MINMIRRIIRGPEFNNFNPRFKKVLRKWYMKGYEKGYLAGKEAPKYIE